MGEDARGCGAEWESGPKNVMYTSQLTLTLRSRGRFAESEFELGQPIPISIWNLIDDVTSSEPLKCS